MNLSNSVKGCRFCLLSAHYFLSVFLLLHGMLRWRLAVSTFRTFFGAGLVSNKKSGIVSRRVVSPPLIPSPAREEVYVRSLSVLEAGNPTSPG